MHLVLKGPGIAAVAQREHPEANRRNPFHRSENINAASQQACFPALYADADHHDAKDFADVIDAAQLVPEAQRRGVGRAQVADGLRHQVVSRIGQRRKNDGRRV